MSCLGEEASAPPQMQQYGGPDTGKALDAFMQQRGRLGELGAFASDANAQYRRQLSETDPFLFGNVSRAGQNISSNLQGLLPTDVASRIARSSAFGSIQGGYGGGSRMGRAAEARNLGLTSLDLMNQGFGQLQSQARTVQSLTPFSAGQFLISPQQLQQQAFQTGIMNTDLANQNAMMQYEFEQANRDKGFLGTALGIAGGVAGGMFGGPMGAGIGMQMGGQLGGSIQGAAGGNEDYYGRELMSNAGGFMGGSGIGGGFGGFSSLFGGGQQQQAQAQPQGYGMAAPSNRMNFNNNLMYGNSRMNYMNA